MHCFEFFQYCTQGIGEENQVPYAAWLYVSDR